MAVQEHRITADCGKMVQRCDALARLSGCGNKKAVSEMLATPHLHNPPKGGGLFAEV
jgi:hypothetical protein